MADDVGRPTRKTGIGTENESSLHAALKEWLAQPGDELEVPIGGYVADIQRGDLLIEVQTSSFSSIRHKLEALVGSHSLLLAYPIPLERWIVKVDVLDGHVVSRRKSPKRGKLHDLFDELVRIPHLVDDPHLTVMAILTREEQMRCDDGRGSWRRNGISIVDRRLLEVVETVTLRDRADYVSLLPDGLQQPFTNRDLAELAGLPVPRARRMTYCLRRMGALRECGRRGRETLYELYGEG